MELIITTAVILGILLIVMDLNKNHAAEVNPITYRKYDYPKLLYIGASAVLLFVACYRQGFVDTAMYKELYRYVGTDFNMVNVEAMDNMEDGFVFFMVLLNHISPDPQLLVIVTAFITIGSSLYIIWKYAYDVPFSLFLFFTVSYMGQLNGIRQVLVGAILQLALVWALERKTVPYIILVLLLSNFHTSVLVMIPLYFIISGKRTNWGIILFLVGIAFCFFAPSVANQLMGELLEDSVYEEYLDNELKMGVMRLLVALAPLVLTMILRFRTPREDTKNGRLLDVLINLHIMNVGFTSLGMTMVYFARISMYANIAMPLLIPRAIDECFEKNSAKLLKALTIAMYGLYFLYQAHTYNTQGYFYDFKLNI